MANTVTKNTIKQRGNRIALDVAIEFDGSGQETDTVLLDISTLTMADGTTVPTKVTIVDLIASLSGMNYAPLETDHTTDQLQAILPNGLTVKPFGSYGGKVDTGTGGTGDLIITSDGAVDGSALSLFVELDIGT